MVKLTLCNLDNDDRTVHAALSLVFMCLAHLVVRKDTLGTALPAPVETHEGVKGEILLRTRGSPGTISTFIVQTDSGMVLTFHTGTSCTQSSPTELEHVVVELVTMA
jgi:hypothetical protein